MRRNGAVVAWIPVAENKRDRRKEGRMKRQNNESNILCGCESNGIDISWQLCGWIDEWADLIIHSWYFIAQSKCIVLEISYYLIINRITANNFKQKVLS